MILAAGTILLVDWQDAIHELRAELEAGNYALARMTSGWPNYPWRGSGGSILIIGITVLAVCIIGVAA